MSIKTPKPKLVVIVGPTASGKTSLSISLAQRFNGEIISADSRQVYRGLDLGTGKISTEEMAGIPHHLLDVADPSETYTVHEFTKTARDTITNIHARTKLPIMVGGTFLYIDSVLGKIVSPAVEPNPALREKLEQETTAALFTELAAKDPQRAATIDPHNRRRLIRALEIVEVIGVVPPSEIDLPYDTLMIGLQLEKEALRANIQKRLQTRLELGMIDEVTRLIAGGLSHERLEELGIEYKYISQFLRGLLTETDMRVQIENKSWQYAKRQLTWLKRDESIHWYNPTDIDQIITDVQKFLADSDTD